MEGGAVSSHTPVQSTACRHTAERVRLHRLEIQIQAHHFREVVRYHFIKFVKHSQEKKIDKYPNRDLSIVLISEQVK